jgi:hypothetical protein
MTTKPDLKLLGSPHQGATEMQIISVTNGHLPLQAGEVLEYRQPSRVLRILLDATALLAVVFLSVVLVYV